MDSVIIQIGASQPLSGATSRNNSATTTDRDAHCAVCAHMRSTSPKASLLE
jgi:hypothetical protein